MGKKKKMVKFNPSDGNADNFVDEASISKFLDKMFDEEDYEEKSEEVGSLPIPEAIQSMMTGSGDNKSNVSVREKIKDLISEPDPETEETPKMLLMKQNKISYGMYIDYLNQFHFTDGVSNDITVPYDSAESCINASLDDDLLGTLILYTFMEMLNSSVPTIRAQYTKNVEEYLDTHCWNNFEWHNYKPFIIKQEDFLTHTSYLNIYIVNADLCEDYSLLYINGLMDRFSSDLLEENPDALKCLLLSFLLAIERECNENSYLSMNDDSYIKFLDLNEKFNDFENFKKFMDEYCTTESLNASSLSNSVMNMEDVLTSIRELVLGEDNSEESEGVSNDNEPFHPESDDNESDNGDRCDENDREIIESSEHRCDVDVSSGEVEEEIREEERLEEAGEDSEAFEDFEIEGSEEVEEEGEMVVPVIRS
jgi:hypothetical protein